MFGRLTAFACALLPFAVLAETPSASSTATQATEKITQAIEQKLTQQGFTEVEILPGSFVVSARNKAGDPITLLVGPNSTIVLPQQPGQQQARVPETAGDEEFKWY